MMLDCAATYSLIREQGFRFFTGVPDSLLKPDVAAPGGVYSANADSPVGSSQSAYGAGTSMAAPHAAGVAALVVEPVIGEGGYIVPPPTFLPRLREIYCGTIAYEIVSRIHPSLPRIIV